MALSVVNHPLANILLTSLRDESTPPPLFRLLTKRLSLVLAAGAAPLQEPPGPGQVLVGGAAALLGEHGRLRHPPGDGPAGARPALGEAVAGLLAPGEHQQRGHVLAPQVDGVLQAGLVDG